MTTKPPVPTDDPNTPAGTTPTKPPADSKPPAAPKTATPGTTTPTPATPAAPAKTSASTPTAATKPAAPTTPPADSSPTKTNASATTATTSSVGSSSAKPSDADTESIPVVVGESAAAGPKAVGSASAAGTKTAEAGDGGGNGPWWKAPWRAVKKIKWRRNPWVTVGSVVVVVLVIAAVGYFAGLGPMNRLNTARGIEPPAKLAGLDRITDEEIRGQLQLDQTREALSRINDGKQATVEAYGDVSGSRMFIVIALRGKVDIDKTIKDSGAAPDLVKVVGQSTCVESTDNLPTQCYRGSNTLTVIAQSANEGVGVDTVGPVADEAFAAMK